MALFRKNKIKKALLSKKQPFSANWQGDLSNFML